MAETAETIRLDKWLWQARFYKTRSLAAEAIEAGRIRVDGVRVTKPGRSVRVGSTITLRQNAGVRLVRIAEMGARRGPSSEALTLYLDLDPGTNSVPSA